MFNVQTKCKMFYPTSKRAARLEAIRQTMAEWREGRPEPVAYNNSLRGYITVNARSLRETCYWGSKTEASATVISRHMNEILRYAVKQEEVQPRSVAGGRFEKLIILHRKVEGMGTAKLTVGVRPDGSLVQYCITAVEAGA